MSSKGPVVTERQPSSPEDSRQTVARDEDELKKQNKDANRPGQDTRIEQAEARTEQAETRTEQAKYCCRLAKELEKAGEYEAACEAVLEFWPQRAEPPIVEGLDQETTAHVFLRVGALAGWLGSAAQAEACADGKVSRPEVRKDIGQVSMKNSLLGAPIGFDKLGDVVGGVGFTMFQVGGNGSYNVVQKG